MTLKIDAKFKRKLTCAFKNDTWNLVNFNIAIKSLKIGTLMGSTHPSRKCMSLKFTGELCVMIMKNDARFEEEITCQFKIDMRNSPNFDPST